MIKQKNCIAETNSKILHVYSKVDLIMLNVYFLGCAFIIGKYVSCLFLSLLAKKSSAN